MRDSMNLYLRGECIEPSIVPLSFGGAFYVSRTSYSPYRGLREYGPYERIRYMRIWYLKPRELTDSLKEALDKMLEVIEENLKVFLKVPNYEIEPIKMDENLNVNSLRKVFKNYITDVTDKENLILLVPIFRRYGYSSYETYVMLKVLSLEYGVPSQVYTERTLNVATQKGRKFPLFNLSLNIFAKVGGIPWVLAEDLGYDLIVGFNWCFYREGKERVGPLNKVFAYANIFKERGVWAGLLTCIAEEQEYIDALCTLLETAIRRYTLTTMRFKDRYEILIMSSKILKQEEIQVLRREIEEKYDNISLTIAQITDATDIRMYDSTTEHYMAPRGSYFFLDYDTVIYLSTGIISVPYDEIIKELSIGTPVPIKIKLLYPCNRKRIDSNVRRLKKIVKCCHMLTAMNWRSLKGYIRLPTPLHYSKCIAKFVRNAVSFTPLSRIFIKMGEIYKPKEPLDKRPWFI